MGLTPFDEDDFSVKWLDTKEYIRVNSAGEVQLIRLEPVNAEDGTVIPDTVSVYVDESGPVVMSRMAAEAMIASSNCEPLEKVAQWKHRKIN